MSELTQFPHGYTKVFSIDEIGSGNAHHKYTIERIPETSDDKEAKELITITFQDGPIKEAGINGVMDENLIAIAIDRLQGFQKGLYSCKENAMALTKLEEALLWLNHRTAGRLARGVEGTHKA